MLPLHDDNPVRHPPVVNWLIIAACIVVYFAWQPTPFQSDAQDTRFDLKYAAIPCELVHGRPLDVTEVTASFRGDSTACNIDGGRSSAVEPGKNVWLAAVTSMFLHGSVLHLGFNMLFLWIFGNNVEDAMGKVGYTAFYLAGGAVATATYVAFNLDSTVPLIGASGAIAAVMGAYFVLFPNARVLTLVFIVILPIRAKWVLGAWFVLQFFTNPNTGVAWAAHVGGFVFGLLVALFIRSARGAGPPAGGWRPPPSRPVWGRPQFR